VLRRVVEQHDAARLHIFQHPLGDLLRGDPLPIQTVDAPLYRGHAHAFHGGDDVVVIFAVRAAEQRGTDAGDGLDLVVGRVDVGGDILGGELGKVGVIVGMVHDLVARVGDGLYGLRVFIHPCADHKEGGLHSVLVEDVDERLGILIPPGGVEGDGDGLILPLHGIDRQYAFRGGSTHHGGAVHHPEDGRHRQHQRQRGDEPVMFFQSYRKFGQSASLPVMVLVDTMPGFAVSCRKSQLSILSSPCSQSERQR